MNAYAIGLSALAGGQRGLDVVGHNVANSATPGYHRQEVRLVDRVYDGINGVGVAVKRVVRAEDRLLHSAVLGATTDVAFAESRLGVEQQVETALSAAGLDPQIGAFFNDIERLTARPDDTTLRRAVISDARAIAMTTSNLSNDLTRLRLDVAKDAYDTVDRINAIAGNVAKLNCEIMRIELAGADANDLRDHRDQLIGELSGLIDVRVVPQDGGSMTILSSNAALVVGVEALPMSLVPNGVGNLELFGSGPPQALNVGGGKLAALMDEHNRMLPEYLARLDELARGLMRHVDGIQATGLDRNGPVTFMAGLRGVSDVNAPLNAAGLTLPPQAGELHILVTDQTSGIRTLHVIAIDPATQSLQDVAAAITAGTGGRVVGSVNATTGTLELQAAAGFAFDFAGQLPTNPDNVVMNGTSIPRVTGVYDGSVNDVFSFEVLGAGTIGVTPGLALEVRDGAGALVTTLNIGAGYTPDTDLDVGRGIRVRLSAGTSANGTFSARLIAEPDTAGILAALGMNSLFTGGSAATMAVRPDLLANPSLLSAGRTNDPGDGRNLERLAALRDQPLLAGGTRTFQRFQLETIGLAGEEVRTLGLTGEAAEALRAGFERQHQAVVGVDVNEEMVRLLEFQRLVEAGSRFLGITNEALDEIMNIVR